MIKQDSLFNNFQGTVDELLNHVANVSTPEQMKRVERVIEDKNDILNPSEAVAFIMEEFHVSHEEAKKIHHEIMMEEVSNAMKKLCDEGLLYIHHYDENGQPSYLTTELGKSKLGSWDKKTA